MCIPDTGRCIFVLLGAPSRVVVYNFAKADIQGVHKVSLQLKKITTTSNDEISQWGLFYVNQNFIKFLLLLKFIVSDKISSCFMIELHEPP